MEPNHLIVSIEFFIISSNLAFDRAFFYRSGRNLDASVKNSDAIAKYE
jgi:hypothetical protein